MTEHWKDRWWTLLTLFVGVVIGGVIGFGTSAYNRYEDKQERKQTTILLLKTDVGTQIDSLQGLAIGFHNIKKGKPNISTSGETVDRALLRGPKKISLTLPPHKSLVWGSLASNLYLYLLPEPIIKKTIIFYEGLNNCEAHRVSCEATLQERAFKNRTDDSPDCEIYMKVLDDAVLLGKQLLGDLSKI